MKPWFYNMFVAILKEITPMFGKFGSFMGNFWEWLIQPNPDGRINKNWTAEFR